MLIGYSLLDPIIVIGGTLFSVYLLSTRPIRLIGWMPAVLSFYFFIPLLTLMTLWQTVFLVLTARAFLKFRLNMAQSTIPIFMIVLIALSLSLYYSILFSSDDERAIIRLIYYSGIIALLSFSYEMGKRQNCYKILVTGLAVTGVVLALYGVYQIIAVQVGLPLRGIVRGATDVQMAFENGLLRINSFASEPKRLGYVLFLGALACVFLARLKPDLSKLLWLAASGILATSVFTFAGSYFGALFIFICVSVLLYPSRFTGLAFGALLAVAVVAALLPDFGLYEALVEGYTRRMGELEVGLDGQQVYRQEFFAQEYLEKHPLSALFGVGLGQYFTVLHEEYGTGVGFNEFGGLIPMNSTFLEIVYDFGGIIATLFYAAIAFLIWKLRRAGEHFLCLALLFVLIQSAFILTLPFMVFFAGLGTARLEALRRERKYRNHLRSFRSVDGQSPNT